MGAPQRGPTPNLERRPTNIRSPRDVRSRGRESPRLASNRPCAESMGARPTVDFPHASEERARIPQEMSNFYCHPGKAGGSPMILVNGRRINTHHIRDQFPFYVVSYKHYHAAANRCRLVVYFQRRLGTFAQFCFKFLIWVSVYFFIVNITSYNMIGFLLP